MQRLPLAIGAAVFAMLAATAQAGMLDDLRAKGHVQCGVNTGLAGFSIADSEGN